MALHPLPPQLSRAKAAGGAAATTLDAHLDGGLLSSLESLLRSSPARHRMRVAGLRLLAALAAAGASGRRAARTANRRRDSLPGSNSDPVAEAAVAGLKQVAATGEKP